jgi:hypothetical protein
MTILRSIEEGCWGIAVRVEPQKTELVEYDDDECECNSEDECAWSPNHYAICYSLGDRLGSFSLLENHSALLAVPKWDDSWFTYSTYGESAVYAVMPTPLLDASRLKVGKTKNIVERMKQFRTSCPYALLVGLWPGGNEDSAHAALHSFRIGRSEVFQTDNVWESLEVIHQKLT